MDDRTAQNAIHIKSAGDTAVCFIFLAMLAFFGVFFVISEKREFSDIENRELAKAPQLIVDGQINRDFYEGLEMYFSDSFPFRDSFLLANRKIQGLYAAARLPASGGDSAEVVFFGSAPGGGSQGQTSSAGAGQSNGDMAEMPPSTEILSPAESSPTPRTISLSEDSMTGDSTSGDSTSGDSTSGDSTSGDSTSADFSRPTGSDTAATTAPSMSPESSPHAPAPSISARQTASVARSALPEPTAEPPTATPAPTPEPAPDQDKIMDFGGTGVALVNNQAIELFTYSEERTLAYASFIDGVAEKTGIPTYIVTPPSAAELYLPDIYREQQNYQKQAFDLMKSTLKKAKLIDFFDEFRKEKDNYIYFRSDHHWTADGAYIAYANFARTAGFEPARKADMVSGSLDGFLGSLYRQVYLEARSQILESEPDFVRYYEPLYGTSVLKYDTAKMVDGVFDEVIKPDGLNDTNLYNVFFGGDIRLLFMQSEVANGKSIMVIRDSYGHAFLPFLANNYERVYAVEPRYFDEFPLTEFVREHDIDELIFLNHSLSATSAYWLNWVDELKKLK